MRLVRTTAAIFGIAAAATLAACNPVAPIHNVKDAPVVPASGKALQASQVRQAIMSAGTSLGWNVKDAGAGRLEGTLNLRTHIAVVDIPYTSSTYSINFKRGDNLNVTDATIHRNYNGWVQNLDRAIRTELTRF